jgi:hypothetical protein
MRKFLSMPTRGGKLTILNCLLWAIVALGVAVDRPALTLPGLIACWPIAWWFILPGLLGGYGYQDMVVECVVIGMNSLLWGYGISWVLSLFEKRRVAREGVRGFEVVQAAVVEEAGRFIEIEKKGVD